LRIETQVHEAVERLELPFNALGLDPYGISKKYLERFFTVLAIAYRYYFSVRARGVEHVPARGRAMLVGNHSGGIPIDATMVIACCLLEVDPPRLAQGMVERFLNRFPVASLWASRTGQFTGSPEHAERLLNDDRLLLVFPEGSRGTAKLFRDRYSLVHFGSGFMRLALKTRAPIVPFVVLGASEAFPTVVNAYRLGRVLGIPYVPIVPYGLPIALPVKVEIEFGAPLHFAGTGNEDDAVVAGYVDQVKSTISEMLERGTRRRRGEPVRESA
jgi:1-acyl-sn-glycerol-3-phosphate acyltransferase